MLTPMILVNTADQNISLNPGTYDVDIRLKRGEAYFEFALTDKNSKKQTFRFQVPNGFTLPEGSGRLFIPAYSSKQPWDLKGEVTSKQSKTDIQKDFEQCTLQRMFTQCSQGQPVRCRQIWKTFPGKRNVEFYDIVNERDLRLQITDPVSSEAQAKFSGEAIDRWRVYTYRGDCFWVTY